MGALTDSMVAVLASVIWMALGAAIAVTALGLVRGGAPGDEPWLAPHARLLGMPCWLPVGGRYEKHRVVAVSHKGSVCVRAWDDDSGRHAFWIDKRKVKAGAVVFGEFPEKGWVES